MTNVADRLIGSQELYSRKRREAEQSVNFVTCHDGFTLNDLVSYDQKHNQANGEDNRDGANDNRSWNCGVEGPTNDPGIERLRNQQVENLLTVTLLSLGLPMIVMGDEVRRTQNGNNNPYCQDNEASWFDWSLVEKHADVLRFVRLLLLERRRLRNVELERQRVTLNEGLSGANKAWHGIRLDQPDWSSWSHRLALSAEIKEEKLIIHLILNAYWEPLEFELLPVSGADVHRWRRWIDTALDPPNDIVDWRQAPSVPGFTYRAGRRSVVMLFASLGEQPSPKL